MSSYAQKLKVINDRKKKLLHEESRLLEQRKKEIGALAERLGLLSVSDEILIAAFEAAKKKALPEPLAKWENEGGHPQPNAA
jgi:DNA-binding protein H-NS